MSCPQRIRLFLKQCFVACAVFAAASGPVCNAATSDSTEVARRLIDQICLDCHQGAAAEGGLDLSVLPWQLESAATRRRWVDVHDRVAGGEMPPDSGQLAEPERQSLLAGLSTALHQADLAQVRRSGRGPMRRLTRGEYQENLRDLLRLPQLDVRDILPEDREVEQCNKVAAALDMTRVQLDAYLDAADVALRQAVAPATQPPPAKHYRALATKLFPKAIDHGGRESSFYAKNSQMIRLTAAQLNKIRQDDAHDPEIEFALFRSAAWPYYGYPVGFLADRAGTYQVRFFARAVRQLRDFRLLPATDPQPMTFRARKPTQADVSGDVRPTGGTMDIEPEGRIYETSVYLKSGETFEYSLLGLPVPHPITDHGGPLYYNFPPMPQAGHPGVAFSWIEITGPIVSESWPPESHRVLFGKLPLREAAEEESRQGVEVISDYPVQDARRLLHRFATDAARRPVPEAALEPYEQLILNQLDEGQSFTKAMLAGYRAFLCSSHFLFLPEPQSDSDQFAIASRLSHFLWHSPPDPNLLQLAKARSLHQDSVLRAETDRMVNDKRFDKFIRNFTDHWLDLKDLVRDAPDIRLYPEYRGDDYLIESMARETRAFVKAIFQENLPVATLVDSEFALVNDRLAQHYDLPPVPGSVLRRVKLPAGSPRGGLLTQAAILKVTANGTTTSPILRGAWVMDRIFGDPPPPPPPNVPAVEPDLRGAATIREILQAHAKDPACGGCHRRFDPVGLALENFDVMGGWRQHYRSLGQGDEITGIDRAGHKYSYRVAASVDCSGELHDGTKFATLSELQRILQKDPRPLARNLLSRLVTYATGTPVRFSDRREIDSILQDCRKENYRAGDLLRGLVQSRIFKGVTNASESDSRKIRTEAIPQD